MNLDDLIWIFIGIVVVAYSYTYIGYLFAETRFKYELKSREETIKNLNDYIDFLQTSLIAERRRIIDVSISETEEDVIYEN